MSPGARDQMKTPRAIPTRAVSTGGTRILATDRARWITGENLQAGGGGA